jgi:hypothetical protein
MIHWFQSIEGVLLLALDGRSLSWLPNCAIFRKTLTTVPTKTIKEVPDSKSSSTFVCSNDITTRSDWTYCIFCKKKSYKKKHKLLKIESQVAY